MDKRMEALGPVGDRASFRLRELRRSRGLTLQQLADRLVGLGRPILLSALSKIEKGQRRIDVDDLVVLALALEVSPNLILLPQDKAPGLEVLLAPKFALDAASAWKWASSQDFSEPAPADVAGADQFHEFAVRFRQQTTAFYGRMRRWGSAAFRAVPYEQMHVEPMLRLEDELSTTLDLAGLALPGRRTVILGDPGSGKSTLVTKLAFDIASDHLSGAEGQVPFTLVLRQLAHSLNAGEKGLVHYLEQICRNPFNVDPPPGAVDYLLRMGRAVVLLDGLDELTEPALRRRFVQLIDGFAHLYPRIPLVVTGRLVGYAQAPLDPQMFTVGRISQFNDDQIRQYATRWFALDESVPSSERARLAESFLAESADFPDLRANVLMLDLLCAMYSTEGYIPRNLVGVLARCAEMLFDRWDRMRGINIPFRFDAHLRPAVGYLAWRLFEANESGSFLLSRRRLVQILTEFLKARRFDNEDDAVEAAGDLVEFCTGRAWVFSDVGSAADGEPIYGFTHRTFLEYFAAEHLVRTHSTPEELWEVLRPRVMSGRWETVAQMAVQLLDRNRENGADALLRMALAGDSSDQQELSHLRSFAKNALRHVYVTDELSTKVRAFALSTSSESI